MIENGMRLNLSVTGNDFTVVDQLTDGLLVYKQGNYVSDSLEHVDVITCLRGLVDQLVESRMKPKLFGCSSETVDSVILVQRKHGVFDIDAFGTRGFYDNGKLRCGFGFDVAAVVSSIGYIIETLCKTGNTILDLKTSAVRRYVDADLIVARGNGHEIVVRRSNIYDNVLRNVLYDKEMLPFLYVDIHAEEGEVLFFGSNLHLMCTMQYDASFDVYFTPDDDSFNCEG